MKRAALALTAVLAFVGGAAAQVYPIVVPSTGASPPATPAGIQQLISGTNWINGVNAIGGRNWRDNYQIIHDTLNGMGYWDAQGIFHLAPASAPNISGDLSCALSANAQSIKCLVASLNGVAFAPSATIDTTNANNIASGTLAGARLPAPSATVFGGVLSATAPAHQFSIGNVAGAPQFAQPGIADIVGNTAGDVTGPLTALKVAMINGVPAATVAAPPTTVADANYSILTTDRTVVVTALTAPRVLTLPLASAYASANPVGQVLVIQDLSNSITAAVILTLSPVGNDTIGGSSASILFYPGQRLSLTAASTGWIAR